MIIIQLAGGLGNQMQQYAIYHKFKKLHPEETVKLDTSWYTDTKRDYLGTERELELGLFEGLPMEVCSEEEKRIYTGGGTVKKVMRKLFPESSSIFTESAMYHQDLFELRDKYISGYFACPLYYEDVMDELRELYRFPAHRDPEARKIQEQLLEEVESRPSVSVSIRRGDYLNEQNEPLFGNIATERYYESAMNLFLGRDPKTHFYIFTNDPEYIRQRYTDEERYTVVTHNAAPQDSLLDIQLMSRCMGNICANSTFSLWGGRLNNRPDRTRVKPLRMRNNQVSEPHKMHTYWKDWILIDREGEIV